MGDYYLFNSIASCDLNGIFETVLQRQYANDSVWRDSLPRIVDVINLKLKEYEEMDWKSGERGRLKDEGLASLGNVIKKRVKYANRKSTQVVDLIENLVR